MMNMMKMKMSMKTKKIIPFLAVLVFCCSTSHAQMGENPDSAFIRQLHEKALTQSTAYPWLQHICLQIGGRLSGSPQAAQAVEYTKSMLDTLGLTQVWLQPCMVTHWVRGEKEEVTATGSVHTDKYALHALALGNSVATPKEGITGEVVEVHSLQDVENLKEQVRGKIVFYNRPMNPTRLSTFQAYGEAGDQRRSGASVAAKYGAIGVLTRSLGLRLDNHPHTGALAYKDSIEKIPAAAISTNDAEKLSAMLKAEKVKVHMRTNCQMFADAPSNNVIGEIKGSEFPDQIIVVGAHLDSWDPGQGAHDDGAGVVQSMGVLQLLKNSGYKPKRTIRCVLFMNEENGTKGAAQYAAEAARKKENHIAAIESDEGGFTPRGFSFEAIPNILPDKFAKVTQWADLLAPYGLDLSKGGSGSDVEKLKAQSTLLIGFKPDSQRYFDYHHTEIDTFDAVSKRELELGMAAMASLVYLMDKYGL